MTQEYYYADGRERRGPVDLEALRSLGITRDTLVWREGMPDWRPAGELPELSSFFVLPGRGSAPPPIRERPRREAAEPLPASELPGGQLPAHLQSRDASPAQAYPPKTYLVESILATILCCLPFGIVGIVYASRVENRFYSGDLPGAEAASRQAEKWTKIAAATGLGLFLIFFALSLLGETS